MRTSADHGDTDAKSDMTPMIDVVFLMIVFFVCIDFRVLEAKLPAFLPRDLGTHPTAAEPQEQLPVRVHVTEPGTAVWPPGTVPNAIDPNTGRPARFVLRSHRVRFEVGPRLLDDAAGLARDAGRIVADPVSQVPHSEGTGRRLLACVVEAGHGACYDDVARTVDACRAAGFTDIRFGSGILSFR